jgi:hypothetical protein
MKKKKILSAFVLILFAMFVVQCEKYGNRPDNAGTGDEDSDRPEWAGGGDGVNPHQNPNPSPGISKGGDYGDLYVLLRTVDGVPVMTPKTVDGVTTWYVQPVAEDGITPLELNEEGELLYPELATAVDFGRLNIVRSPPSVLEQAFNESMKVLTGQGVDGRIVIDITLDFCGRLTSEYSDDNGVTSIFKTIDSPRENMAIYKEIMKDQFDGRLAFLSAHAELDPLTVAASCFAAGSDKTGTVDIDEVVYINTFMDCIGDPLTAILNENEYDPEGNERLYFNFSTCCDGDPYQYNRVAYTQRYIQFLVEGTTYYPVNEEGYSGGPIYDIESVMEGLVDGQQRFTNAWGDEEYLFRVEAFAQAVDDAVQVLDYIHGDSNIRSVPYSEEENPWTP